MGEGGAAGQEGAQGEDGFVADLAVWWSWVSWVCWRDYSYRGRWRGGGGAVPLWTSCLINGLLGAADCAIFAEVVCEESGMREDDGEAIDR